MVTYGSNVSPLVVDSNTSMVTAGLSVSSQGKTSERPCIDYGCHSNASKGSDIKCQQYVSINDTSNTEMIDTVLDTGHSRNLG